MAPNPPDQDSETMSERFEYFMIRVTRSDKDPERVAGLAERLGSGEKRSFETGDQLLQIVGRSSEFSLTLQPAAGHHNPSDPGSIHPPLGEVS